ncbi:TIGR00296 family protein [Candidatus Woesearchaeota archaeon]|nr:TIGR00296 family protein [Candidatus Woesearchaeota archaeon]
MLSLAQGKTLVRLARKAIESHFDGKHIELDYEEKSFSEKQGVFVTLNKKGRLRGCIGFPEPVFPLNEALVKAARSAAFSDPRFSSLKKHELEKITIEISVLTVPKLIKVDDPEKYLEKIEIGEDGLIVRTDIGSGLLLPQVFVEYNAKPRLALEMTCQKAGLSRKYYKQIEDCKIYKFQAQIFKETEPKGKIIQIREK